MKHVLKSMWIHDVLIDIMVQYFKSTEVVEEHLKVFRRAILLRHVNLYHQERFESERDRAQLKQSDQDDMTSALFRRADGRDHDVDDEGAHSNIKSTPNTKMRPVREGLPAAHNETQRLPH